MDKKKTLERLKQIISFIEDNSRGGHDYDSEWIYCNIKNYGFIDYDDLRKIFPKKYHRFIDQMSEQELYERQDQFRSWEIQYLMECINDNVDGSDRWADVVCSKYTYGRSGGWIGIGPRYFEQDMIEDMIEDLGSGDPEISESAYTEALEVWDHVMECKDWIEKRAKEYSDLEAMKNEVIEGMIPVWDEVIQAEKDIRMIKKLARKHGLQVGRSI